MTREDVIARLGGQDAYEQANNEVRRALIAIARAVDGLSMPAVINASILLALAAMRADGGAIEDAFEVVQEAWAGQTVRDLEALLRSSEDKP
jgi:hypothetical protein